MAKKPKSGQGEVVKSPCSGGKPGETGSTGARGVRTGQSK